MNGINECSKFTKNKVTFLSCLPVLLLLTLSGCKSMISFGGWVRLY